MDHTTLTSIELILLLFIGITKQNIRDMKTHHYLFIHEKKEIVIMKLL